MIPGNRHHCVRRPQHGNGGISVRIANPLHDAYCRTTPSTVQSVVAQFTPLVIITPSNALGWQTLGMAEVAGVAVGLQGDCAAADHFAAAGFGQFADMRFAVVPLQLLVFQHDFAIEPVPNRLAAQDYGRSGRHGWALTRVRSVAHNQFVVHHYVRQRCAKISHDLRACAGPAR